MEHMYFKRNRGKIPFTREEVSRALTEDFRVVKVETNSLGEVESLIVLSREFPNIADPRYRGIALFLQDDNTYMFDPKHNTISEELFTIVIPKLMEDLKLELLE